LERAQLTVFTVSLEGFNALLNVDLPVGQHRVDLARELMGGALIALALSIRASRARWEAPMKESLRRALEAACRRAWLARLNVLGFRPGSGLPPEIWVGGASPSQEQNAPG